MSKKTTCFNLKRYLFGFMLLSQRIPQNFNNNPLSTRLTPFKIPKLHNMNQLETKYYPVNDCYCYVESAKGLSV